MDKRISDLDAVQSLSNNDVLPIVNGNQTRKVSIAQIKASIPTPASPSLQQVTDVNNLTNNPIISKVGFETIIDGETEDISFIGAMSINVGGIISNKGLITLRENGNGSGSSVFLTTESLSLDRSITLPNKSGIIALTSDVPSVDAIPTDSSSNAVSSNGVFDALALKVDKVAGKGLSTNDYTTSEQTKLSGIAAGAEVNINADWNATTGDALILNKPTIPSLSGVELQTNKQNSLTTDGTGVKYPTVDAVNAGILDINTNAIDRVTVKLSVAINKGQAVYVSGANGTNILVSKASNASESTSSKTIGLLETTGAINAIVNVVTDGLLTGLNTFTATIGDPVWLGTNGDLIYGLASKPYAPAHLVYIGVVTRVSATVGEILIKVQNGFELKEIHDVDLITSSPTDKQLLSYDNATSLWKNKSVTTADIAASTNKNYVTDAQATVIGNTSGTNTGDETITTIKTKLGITTLSGSNTGDQDLSGYVPTTRTVNAKPLSANVVLTTADVADSTGRRYQTENQNTYNDATSSIQNQIDTKAPIIPRLQNVTSSATVTPTSLNDLVTITAQAVGLTIANPTGTMTEGQALMIRIKDNGTARSIAFGTNYRALGITLPTTTVISKTMYLGLIWNNTDTKFDVVGLNQEG